MRFEVSFTFTNQKKLSSRPNIPGHFYEILLQYCLLLSNSLPIYTKFPFVFLVFIIILFTVFCSRFVPRQRSAAFVFALLFDFYTRLLESALLFLIPTTDSSRISWQTSFFVCTTYKYRTILCRYLFIFYHSQNCTSFIFFRRWIHKKDADVQMHRRQYFAQKGHQRDANHFFCPCPVPVSR